MKWTMIDSKNQTKKIKTRPKHAYTYLFAVGIERTCRWLRFDNYILTN